jgi:hypothetical protein
MIYLSKDELQESYSEAEKKALDWYKPFDEYERIANNKLSKKLGKNMPRVNDGSLAASLLETPMLVLPSMQPGKFISQGQKKPWLNEIANIIWRDKIVPNASTQATFFDKEQMALYRALKYGAQPRYNFFVSSERYTGSDWSLPYIRNVKLEPGKFSVDDCDYVFLDIYYTKHQLKNIIEQQKDEIKRAKAEGRKPDTTWNVDALKRLADMGMTSKEMEEQNINEREKQVSASGIKVTACFQRGVGAPFYLFSKHLPDKECLREWKNPDPTGDLPITMQYCYETLESPIGIGRVELAGPTQNVLDYMTQAHVLATQIGLQPPKKLSGAIDQTNLNSLTFTPDAIWQTGTADVDIVQTATSVYSQFPANFGLYKAQLQNLQGRTDGSVSSESGDPGFSKTQAGVKMQESRTNAQDNYLRNKADTAAAKMAEKMMNVHMANMSGADILDIAKEDLERLTKAGYFDDNPETPEPSITELPVIYEELQDTFKFEFDPRPETDEDDKNRWVELINIATSNPNLIPAMQASGYEFNLGEAFKKVIAASGADGWDKVLVELNPEDMAAQQMPGEMPQEGMEQPTEQMQDPQEPIEVPEQPPATPEQDPEVLQAIMAEYGVDEGGAMAVIEAERQGFSPEEIADFLNRQGGE